MKLVFVINDIATEKADFTTPRLARRAIERGHEVSLVSLVDISYEADEIALGARLGAARDEPTPTTRRSSADLQADDATLTRIALDDATW